MIRKLIDCDVIELEFEPEDFEGSWPSCEDCAIARALHRLFPLEEIAVGGTILNIGKQEWDICGDGFGPTDFDERQSLARAGKPIPGVRLERIEN